MDKTTTTYYPTIATRNLPRYFTPEKVLADPETLKLKIMDYFELLRAEEKLPTPAGLAMAMGLASFDSILKVMKAAEDDDTIYPKESMSILHYARSLIEDQYIQLGLQERIPQAFTKFLLSAYFARSERIISEQTGAADNNFQINVLGVSSPMQTAAPQQGSIAIEHQPATIDDL